MKKNILLTTALLGIMGSAAAQIPNNGFENWTDMGAYMEPSGGYLTLNSTIQGTVYPVTRSTDHYPANVGSYSIRIDSDNSLLPNDGFGIVMQNHTNMTNNGPGTAFPITGHPTSLTGYYKYTPQNGDSMQILLFLYSNGFPVTVAALQSTDTVSNWTSFNIPIPTYATADSASILLSSYNAGGPPPQYVPHGHSVLYVDNLNFDNLIVGLSEEVEMEKISVYPNPVKDKLTISLPETQTKELNVSIFDSNGKLIFEENTFAQNGELNLDLSKIDQGFYTLRIVSDEKIRYTEKISIVK